MGTTPQSGASTPVPGAATPTLPYDPLASALMHTLGTILACLAKNSPSTGPAGGQGSGERSSVGNEAFMTRANDIIRSAFCLSLIKHRLLRNFQKYPHFTKLSKFNFTMQKLTC